MNPSDLMPEAFYYADPNSQPVGPLSIDEIRRFAEAGVVPRDVMVCEAGGDNWRSLDSFYRGGMGTKASDTPSTPARPLAEMRPAKLVLSLKITYTATILVALVAFALNTVTDRGAVQSGDPYYSEGFDALAMTLTLLSIAGSVALIYLLVLSLPERHRFTTPVKAAGFFLIPVFASYWVFRLLPGLVKGTMQWWLESAPGKSGRLAWLMPFSVITAVFIAVSGILDVVGGVWFLGDPPTKGWEGVIFLSGLAYMLGESAFFHFTLSLLHVLRGLVDPGDYEREALKAKQTPFWKFRPGPWSPSYAFLFPIIFIGIWTMRLSQ